MTPAQSRRVMDAVSRAATTGNNAAAQVQWLKQRVLQLEQRISQMEHTQMLLLQKARQNTG